MNDIEIIKALILSAKNKGLEVIEIECLAGLEFGTLDIWLKGETKPSLGELILTANACGHILRVSIL